MASRRPHVSVEREIFPRFSDEWRNLEKIPPAFGAQWDAVVAHRSTVTAPVDEMGCDRLYQKNSSPASQRFSRLCALLLSPQSRDDRTAASMENLWQNGPLTPEYVLSLPLERLEELIRPSGLYRAKARALRETSAALIERHGGDVPRTLPELLALRGVGPKIAILALQCCWGVDDAGIACDTHVTRISQRLGWAPGGAKAPNGAEAVRPHLEAAVPKPLWRSVNLALVGLGQTICTAKAPRCHECPVQALCPSAAVLSGSKRRKL